MNKIVSIAAAAVIGFLSLQPVMADDNPERIDEAAERLRELLQNAAESGYLSMRGEQVTPDAAVGATTVAAGSKVTARSLRFDSGQVEQVAPSHCEIAEVFDFTAFKEGTTYDDIFQLRNDLVSLRGEYINEIGLDLARSYLALAMPEEASVLTDLMPTDRIQLAGQMASVLSGPDIKTSSEIAAYITCTDKAGLWVAASLIKHDPVQAIGFTKEYITEIGQLPADLQFFFSTQLGILAAEQEDFDLAMELLKKAQKLGRAEDTAILYLESLIGTGRGDQAGLAQLRQVAQTQGPLQPKALFTLGEASETTPYTSFAKDLELVSTQYRGESESDVAQQMTIRFLAEEEQYQQAIDNSRLHFPEFNSNRLQTRDTIATILLKRLTGEDERARFRSLNHYTNNINFFSGFPEEVRLRFSAAKTALYFELPHLLDTLIKEYDFSELQRDVDYISAQAAMLENRADLAWSICSLYEGDPAFDQVSVKAAVALNDPGAALSVLGRMPQTEDTTKTAALIAWQFGIWDRAKEHYADILVSDSEDDINERYNLAAYMSGEQGGFYELKASADLLEIETLFNSYKEERPMLREYLGNG